MVAGKTGRGSAHCSHFVLIRCPWMLIHDMGDRWSGQLRCLGPVDTSFVVVGSPFVNQAAAPTPPHKPTHSIMGGSNCIRPTQHPHQQQPPSPHQHQKPHQHQEQHQQQQCWMRHWMRGLMRHCCRLGLPRLHLRGN